MSEAKMTTRDGVEIAAGDDLFRITEGFAQGVNGWQDGKPYFAERVGEPDTTEKVSDCYSTRAAAHAALVKATAPEKPERT